MNTSYPQGDFDCGGGPANILCGSGKLGVDLMQLIVAPTVAYKPATQHSVGASLLRGHQRFRSDGLQAFSMMSSDPIALTNNGYDTASGLGLRIGYMGRVTDAVTVAFAPAPA